MANSSVKLSPALLQQLGGQVWHTRTGFFEFDRENVKPRSASDLSEESDAGLQVESQTNRVADSESGLALTSETSPSVDLQESSAMGIKASAEERRGIPTEVGTEARTEVSASVSQPAESALISAVSENAVAKVFIVCGVESQLEDESSLQSALWQNIQKAFGWDELDLQLVDVEFIASESAMMNAVDEVIALNVDQVFVMLDEHPIIEILQEGVELVALPSLDEMLDDPYAKQQFYQTVMASI